MHESDSLIEYAISCILFHHKYDNSYKITEAAEKKESELFQGSIQFLRKIAVENKKLKTDVEYSEQKLERVIELNKDKLLKAKEYISKIVYYGIEGHGVITKEELQEMSDFIKEL